MKTYRHFVIHCLECGSVWEESSEVECTEKTFKEKVKFCEDCPSSNIDVAGVYPNNRKSKVA